LFPGEVDSHVKVFYVKQWFQSPLLVTLCTCSTYWPGVPGGTSQMENLELQNIMTRSAWSQKRHCC